MSCSHNSLDRKLDDLLAQRPVAASRDFAARTLQRMRQVQSPDARLDELLSSFPIEASANFASATLWRLRRRNALAWATSLAASVVIALGVGSIISMSSITGAGDTVADKPLPQSSQPHAAAGVAEVLYADPILAELLDLADGLEGAEPLLDPSVVEALDSPAPAQ